MLGDLKRLPSKPELIGAKGYSIVLGGGGRVLPVGKDVAHSLVTQPDEKAANGFVSKQFFSLPGGRKCLL